MRSSVLNTVLLGFRSLISGPSVGGAGDIFIERAVVEVEVAAATAAVQITADESISVPGHQSCR